MKACKFTNGRSVFPRGSIYTTIMELGPKMPYYRRNFGSQLPNGYICGPSGFFDLDFMRINTVEERLDAVTFFCATALAMSGFLFQFLQDVTFVKL